MAGRWSIRGQWLQATRALGVAQATALALFLVSASAVAADEVPPLAPEFALKSTSGQNLRLAEYRGQPVLLTFWADWCGTCQPQLAELAELGRRYADADVAIVAVNIDGADRREPAANAAARFGITVLRDDRQAVARAYALGTLPATLLLDPDGRIRGSWTRYRPDHLHELEAALVKVIGE